MTPNIQNCFTDAKLLNLWIKMKKETVLDVPNDVGLYDMKHTKKLNSARMKDVLHNLPKTLPKKFNCL